MSQQFLNIQTLGLQHFCIQHKNPINEIVNSFNVSKVSTIEVVSKIDLDFIYQENEDSKNFILITEINNWSYVLWRYWDFNFIMNFAKKLSSELNTTVNYYFVDPYIATVRWVFAKEGVVTRAYYESHGEKLVDIGVNEIETDLRIKNNEVDIESVFWNLYKETSVPLELINNLKLNMVSLYTGKID